MRATKILFAKNLFMLHWVLFVNGRMNFLINLYHHTQLNIIHQQHFGIEILFTSRSEFHSRDLPKYSDDEQTHT